LVLTRWRVLVFAAATGLILYFVIPPFFNPDEPQHFSLVVRAAWGDEKKDEIERGIIEMMDRAGWWRTVGMGQPETLPGSFGEIPFISRNYKGDLKDLHRGLFLYHQAAALAIKPLAGQSLERFYVLARVLSFGLFLAALGVFYGALQAIAAGWRRRAEPELSDAAARGEPLTIREGAPLLFVLFLPQALIIALSVGPDPWCILLGAVFFRSAFSVIRGGAGALAVFGLLTAALTGVLSDRSVLVFLPLAVIASIFAFRRKDMARSVFMMGVFILGALVIAVGVYKVFPVEAETNFVLLKARIMGSLKTFGTGMEGAFFSRLAESFFLRFGWMGFGAPRPVVVGWMMSCAAAVAGVAIVFVRALFGRIRRAGSETKVLVFSALAAVTQALLTRLATTSAEVMYAQGRYLFPMLLPIGLLFVTGFREFFDGIERLGSGGLRLARSVFGRGADKINLSEGEGDAKGSRFPGGDVGREIRRPEDDDGGIGIETGGSRARDGFVGSALNGGRTGLAEKKVWEAPGDALVPIGPRPPRLGEWAVTAILIGELLVLGWAVWALILPAFHLTRSTPLPGL
jgi:hypothetical protein